MEMEYKCQTKKVDKIDMNGNPYSVMEDIPYNAADEDYKHQGILCEQQVLFPDGSWKEAGSGILHQPPCDPQYPKEVWKNILSYFTIKSDNLSNEFDKLQNRLLENEDSFQVTLPSGEQIDALLHLQNLGAEIVESEKKKAEANKHLGRTEPEFIEPTYTKEEIKEYAAKEKKVKAFKEAVIKVEKPEIVEDTRLTGIR